MTVHKLLLAAWIPGVPTSKGRPRFSRATGRAYTPAKTQGAERTLAGELGHATTVGMTARELVWPAGGALELEVVFHLPIPASWSNRKREEARRGMLRHTSRPDVDNLAKLVMDSANGVLWADDAQLVLVTMSKTYATTPGVAVTVYRPAEKA